MKFLAKKSNNNSSATILSSVASVPGNGLTFHLNGEPAMQAQVSSHTPHPVRQGAFTLIEVLVVITITSILVGILIPALSAARMQAQQVMCTSSMRQTAMLTFIYAQDNRYYLPHATNYAAVGSKDHLAWSQVIDATDPSTKLRRCPGTGDIRFYWDAKAFGPFVPSGPQFKDEIASLRYHAPNVNFFTRNDKDAVYAPKKLLAIKKGLDRLMLATEIGGVDGNATQRFGGGYQISEGPRFRHARGEAINLSFMDGHAETWTKTDIYSAYIDFFVKSPRIYNPKTLLTDNNHDYYPWGNDSNLNPY